MFVNSIHQKAHETLKTGNVDEAIRLYTEALELSPDHCDILSDRGVAYLHAQDQERCFNDLDRAVELQPNYSYRYACRAFAKSNFKDLEGAVIDYEKAVELDPDDAVAHNNLGLLLEQKGYQSEAKARFERADKLSQQEDNLLGMIDELDKSPIDNPSSEAQQELSTNTRKSELKKVFTSRKQFGEFIDFIKNGFKLK